MPFLQVSEAKCYETKKNNNKKQQRETSKEVKSICCSVLVYHKQRIKNLGFSA